MANHTKTIEQRAFEEFKKKYTGLEWVTSPYHLSNMYLIWWYCFRDGYLAAAKAGKKEISDEKIRKLVEVTASFDRDGTVWGYDTLIGTHAEIIAKIREILESEEKKEEKKT